MLDSSCVVALACAWHEHHEATFAELDKRQGRGETVVLACHALVESYAVLTRLPPPHRVSPQDAHAILRESWKHCPAVSLSSRQHWQLLNFASTSLIAGGRTYDALIVACARRTRAATLLTWNLGHFEEFQGEGLEIVAPSPR